MTPSPIPAVVTLLCAAGAVWLARGWMESRPATEFCERGAFPADLIPVFKPELPGELAVFDGVPAEEIPGSWPGFRGPQRDGVSYEEVPLAETWPEDGPPLLWEVELGEGYAGAAVHAGRVYVLDYDEGREEGEVVPEKRGDSLRCFSLADGQEIWRRWYHLPMMRSHGISRTVPAVTDQHVVTLGPMGQVLCVDAKSGEAKWSIDLVDEYGTVIPEWYAAQCPLIDMRRGKEIAILAPGGDQGVLMIAVDCESGEVLWKTPNPREVNMTHSCVVPMEWQGTDTYVYCSTGGVFGIDSKSGEVLWEYPEWRISPAIVPAPVLLGGNRILLSGGYKAGGVILEIAEDESYEPLPKVVARLDVRTLSAEQQTPIFFDDMIYAVLTRNAGPGREQLTCLSAEGVTLWSSGPDHLFELGPFLVADGKLLLMNDSGLLTMAALSATGFEPLAEARVLEGHESWAPMALAGGRLLVRDLHRMVCLDLRAEAE
jgi:outer membrane protein assembly factor BamB